MQEFNKNIPPQPEMPDFSEKNQSPETTIKATPNNPPWNVLTAVALWISSVIFIFALPMLFITPYLISQDLNLSDRKQVSEFITKDWMAILVGLSSTILAHILTLILAWVIVTKLKTHSFREMLGWKWGGFKFWHLAVLILGIYAIAIGLINLLGASEDELTKILQSSRAAVFLVAFLATFTAPIVEEVVYRGVLYSAFQKVVSVPVAVIIVTVLFSAVHVPQYLPNYATIITITITSLTLTLIRVKTDNLWPCIIFHMVFNGIQSVLLILEPYLPLPETISTQPEKAASIIYFLMDIFPK